MGAAAQTPEQNREEASVPCISSSSTSTSILLPLASVGSALSFPTRLRQRGSDHDMRVIMAIMRGHAALGISALLRPGTVCKHGRGPREADEARGSWSIRLRKGRAWTAAMLVLALDEEPHS